MRYWVGVTDNDWFNSLAQKQLGEVNFWQPSGRAPFSTREIGMPFLFKLKRPNNHIAGGGFFTTFSSLPAAIAWEVFGEANGVGSYPEFLDRLGQLARRDAANREIGCSVLANPFFLSPSEWIEDPPGWSGNIVTGKFYETGETDGHAIWTRVARRDFSQAQRVSDPASQGEKFAEPRMIRPRLGQATFRLMVTSAYDKKCTMTGESTLLALEAAHIIPYGEIGEHEIGNGLLLRADFHRLFDAGLVSVSQDYEIKVSPRIREAYFNGKAYYNLQGSKIRLPSDPTQRPDPDKLKWHVENRFQC